jgi:hypothetical protein
MGRESADWGDKKRRHLIGGEWFCSRSRVSLYSKRKGYVNEQGGNLCLSTPFSPGPIRHRPNWRSVR